MPLRMTCNAVEKDLHLLVKTCDIPILLHNFSDRNETNGNLVAHHIFAD